jgi:hypothetical protein
LPKLLKMLYAKIVDGEIFLNKTIKKL